jgi:hypothetical protein
MLFICIHCIVFKQGQLYLYLYIDPSYVTSGMNLGDYIWDPRGCVILSHVILWSTVLLHI